jgi:signal transduction histidine kinase
MDPARRTAAQVGYAWLRARPFLVDAPLAAAGALLLWVLAPDAAVTALLLVVPLAWRRIRPVPAAAAVAIAALAHVAAVDVPHVAALAVPVALYSVVGYGPRQAAPAFVGVAVVGSGLAGWRWGSDDLPGAVTFTGVCLVAVVAAVAAGEVRRLGRLHEAAAVERARQAEVERAQQARLAASAERARIAREMHDVVAHSLAVMISQADGARYVAPADPEAATRAMGTVAETGRRALADMRGLLGVLREDGTGALPQPGLDEVEDLVDGVRGSGLRVTVEASGAPPRELSRTWQLTAYRIVQESLTNVLKHAGEGVRARVRFGWRADRLRLEVADDGAAPPGAPGDGLGIQGMRQRAATQGGSLIAGPGPAGGWRVIAELPYPPAPPGSGAGPDLPAVEAASRGPLPASRGRAVPDGTPA